MSQRWRNVLVVTFLVAALVLLIAFNVNKPRIMVLHSFSLDLVSNQRFDQGVDEVLKSNRMPIRFLRRSMNLDNLVRDGQQAQALAEARRAIESFQPDVLIVVDDEANALIGKDYAQQAGHKLIYVSINHPADYYGYTDPHRASGIAEQLPLKALHSMMSEWHLNASKRIAAIGVASPSGQAHANQVKSFDWAPHQLMDVALVTTFEEWKAFVQGPAKDADVLLVLSREDLVESDQRRESLRPEKVIAWTEANAKPLPVGVQASYVRRGGGFALSPPRAEQGRLAILFALDWTDRRGPSLPMQATETQHFDVSMRTSLLQRRGIELPAVYTEAARAVSNLYP